MSADLLEELMSSEGKAGHKPSHLYVVYYWSRRWHTDPSNAALRTCVDLIHSQSTRKMMMIHVWSIRLRESVFRNSISPSLFNRKRHYVKEFQQEKWCCLPDFLSSLSSFLQTSFYISKIFYLLIKCPMSLKVEPFGGYYSHIRVSYWPSIFNTLKPI